MLPFGKQALTLISPRYNHIDILRNIEIKVSKSAHRQAHTDRHIDSNSLCGCGCNNE